MEKYAAYLESARCVCRSIIERVSQVDKRYPPASAMAAASPSTYSTSHEHHLKARKQCMIISRHHIKPASRKLYGSCKEPDIKMCARNDSVEEILKDPPQAEKTKPGVIDLEKAAATSRAWYPRRKCRGRKETCSKARIHSTTDG